MEAIILKKFIFKSICFVLSFLFFVSIVTPSYAFTHSSSSDDEYKQGIISELQKIESIKHSLQLGDVSFANLKVSRPINTYILASSGLIESEPIYLLIQENTIVAVASEININNEKKYQISTQLVEQLNQELTLCSEFALIYDKQNCYIFSNNELELLTASGMISNDRVALSEVVDNLDLEQIHTSALSASSDLGYNSSIQTRAIGRYYSCNVSYVTQLPYQNICWAATAACIINYINGTNYTAVDVASNYFLIDFNVPLPHSDIEELLNTYYSLGYTYKQQVPSDSVISNNLRNGKPVWGNFISSSGTGHAVTVFGVDILGGYLSVMDPLFGSATTTTNSNGMKIYRSNYSGNNLYFQSAACKYWS